jgi:TolA-binding protein
VAPPDCPEADGCSASSRLAPPPPPPPPPPRAPRALRRQALDARRQEAGALRAALQDAEGALGAAAEQQQQHSDALQLARRELAERISTTQSSTGDCQELQQRLEQLRGACADMQGRLQRTTQEGDRVSQQAAHARQQQRTLGSAQGERSEWVEQVTGVLTTLSGLQGVTLLDGRLQYMLQPPYTLLVTLDPESGRLAAAALEIEAGPGGAPAAADSELLRDIEAPNTLTLTPALALTPSPDP